jgi:hypothetical protein
MQLYGRTYPRDFTNRFFIGQHMVDRDQNPALPQMLQACKPRELVGQLADIGCDTLYFYMSCHMGNCYYPTRVPQGRVHSAMGGRDLFGEVADACVQQQIALCAVYEFAHLEYWKDWPRAPQDWKHYTYLDGNLRRTRGLCWNTGYGDFVRAQAEEVFSTYPVHGLYLDMLDHPRLNLCGGCRDRFMALFGVEPPTQDTDTESALFKTYRQWAFRDQARFLDEVRATVRQHVPEATVVTNYHWLRCDDLDAMRDATDYPTTDPGIGMGYKTMTHATHTPVVFRTLAEGKAPFDVLYDCVLNGHLEIAPRDPYIAVAAHALANGGYPVPDSMWDRRGGLNPASLGLAREVYAHTRAAAPWVGNWTSLPCAGVYISQETNYFGVGRGDEVRTRNGAYWDSFTGALMALHQEHIPVDVLTKRELQRLTQYAVVYLPNAICLSAQEVAVLRDYVEQGGTLVATGRSSLADEWGRPHPNFSLAEVFGVDWTGDVITPYVAVQMHLASPEAHPLKPWENPSITVNREALVIEARASAHVHATLHDRYRPSRLKTEMNELRNAFVVDEPAGPAIVENRFGNGRCLYFSPMAFAAYAQRGFPLIRKLATRWLVADERRSMSVSLRAPCSVKLTAFERPADAQWILHLVNSQSIPADAYYETADTRQTLPITTDVLPVHDLELTLRHGAHRLKTVHMPLADTTLEACSEDGETRVRIPKVHLHEIVVVQFEAAWPVRTEPARVALADRVVCPDDTSPANAAADQAPGADDELGMAQE